MVSAASAAPKRNADRNPASSSSSALSSSLCEECELNPWKYRCPGCSIRTCTLQCVKAHKNRTGCTGKRDRTSFVYLPHFDDDRLLSDYNLLEETKRVSESAFRMQSDFAVGYDYKKCEAVQLLLNATRRRKIRLLTLPSGMSKRKSNQSKFDKRRGTIFWTIEWRFHGTDVVLTDHRVNEHLNLSVVFRKHLAPGPWNHPLRPFFSENLNDLKFFLKKNAVGLKSPYRLLSTAAPVGKQFKNAVIVEYPVIYIFLPWQRYDFEVEAWSDCDSEQGGGYTFCDTWSSMGRELREEEIEKGVTSHDATVLNLLPNGGCCSYTSPFSVTDATHDVSVEQAPNKIAKITSSSWPQHNNEEDPIVGKIVNKLTPHNASGVTFGMYEFELELRDAYENAVGEIDPDEFLCLDGGYSGHNLCLEGDYLIQDELEEGEIPSY